MNEILTKIMAAYDSLLKGKKTYILTLLFTVVAIYAHSTNLDVGEISNSVDGLMKLLENNVNQAIILLGTLKAFNRAAQNAGAVINDKPN